MTEPRRADRQPHPADVPERDRDARIEELLLAGLDYYFSEQYELAINVGTRVLFIDRGHARARAYIERARGAVAERQRKGDELLHSGSAAFERGDASTARELVGAAVDHGASADEALALLARIDRFENISQGQPVPSLRRHPDAPRGTGTFPPARWRWVAAGLGAGSLLGALVLGVLVSRGIGPWPLLPPAPTPAAPPFTPPLPVPTIAELALSEAEALAGRGHLHDALVTLARVPMGDPLRQRADALASEIQRQLLAAGRSSIPSAPAPAGQWP